MIAITVVPVNDWLVGRMQQVVIDVVKLRMSSWKRGGMRIGNEMLNLVGQSALLHAQYFDGGGRIGYSR